MRQHFTKLALFLCIAISNAQSDYPVPERTQTRLFYIQHSNNHNTYVYDTKIENGSIDKSHPIKEYRIVYTQNGKIKPLSEIQRRFAYGMILTDSNKENYKLRLAASKKLIFTLETQNEGNAKIHVTINNRKIYLDRMYIQLKKNTSGLKTKAEYVLFYGKDYDTNEAVIEKLIVK